MPPSARHYGTLVLAFGILCLNLARKSLRLYDGYLPDTFHHGEFFAAFETLLRRGHGYYPITIHGIQDYFPAAISYHFFGEDRYFLFAVFLHQCIEILTGVLFFFLVFSFLKNRPKSALLLLTTALLTPHLVMYKDFLLVTSVFLYFAVQRASTPALRCIGELALGAVVAVGLFWSFDRGLVGALSLGIGCLVQALRSPRYRLSLAMFAICVPLLGLFGPEYSIINYAKNVLFLIDTSSQWSYGLWVHAVRLTILLAAANLLVLSIFVFHVDKRSLSIQEWGNYIFLLVLSALLFKMGANRADAPHILSALWGPLLLCLYWRMLNPDGQLHAAFKAALTFFLLLMFFASRRYQDIGLLLIILALMFALYGPKFPGRIFRHIGYVSIALMLIPLYSILHQVNISRTDGSYKWLRRISEVPDNASLALEDVRWAANEITKSGAQCLFDFTNSGLINGLTKLPTCTQVTYPVYASPKYEPQMIEELRQERPPAIVYSSKQWHFAIDGKPMPDRLPALAQYLQKNYGNERCSSQYCIRYLHN